MKEKQVSNSDDDDDGEKTCGVLGDHCTHAIPSL